MTDAERAAQAHTNAWPALSARTGVGLLVFVAAEAYFLIYFAEARWQPTVDLAWLVASVAWCAAVWRPSNASLPRLRQPYWFYGAYAAALVPFSTNWRWVMAGDTLSYVFMGVGIADHGPSRSLLSVNGPDQFGHFQMVLDHLFMFIFWPTMFWDRLGKITVAVLAMAAVYTVFARLVSRSFGLLVAACSATCSVWIVYTYGSFPFLNGIAAGYALLAVGLWVRRDPESRVAWLTLGGLSGFMLFLTPNGWFMALCVWGWLTPQVLFRRWSIPQFVLAAATGLVVGCPMLIQWLHGSGGQLFSLVGDPGWTVQKVTRFFLEAAEIPFYSLIDNSGAFGPQLPWGFRWLFIPGIVLTPLFGKRFPGARFVFSIYVIHVIILALAETTYAGVSVKRALVLIPMATYFVFLPFHAYLRSLPVVLVLIAAWASFGVYDVVANMKPGRTGYTLLDGVVEAHQRFPDVPVCVFLPHDGRATAFLPRTPLDRLYHLSPHIKHVTDADDPACSEVLCYCSQQQCEHVDLAARGYVPVPLLSSVELRCGRKPHAVPDHRAAADLPPTAGAEP